ncbi:MAG TPA: diguanylate cyclase, partial [Sulfurimonas sp.]|uniref:GGDEF domain-containing protein n=1 Tax=Sulfurimonas sp. TaxID=2022749 RepID=UPI002CC88D74
SYSEKKGMKDRNFTSVTVFEVDNFSKTNKAYSQELTQSILKKIAFSISLHQQITDVIARTDYNQFTVILSRETKEQLFKDADNIRHSISELKLSSTEAGEIELSISGGHVTKPNNQSLEEAIRQAKKVLLHAQKKSKNIISQVKDLAHSEL